MQRETVMADTPAAVATSSKRIVAASATAGGSSRALDNFFAMVVPIIGQRCPLRCRVVYFDCSIPATLPLVPNDRPMTRIRRANQ
jgi:hypothetical protein